MLRASRFFTLPALAILLSGCPAVTRMIGRTAACVSDVALERWLGTRLREPDWSTLRDAPRSGQVLGRLITCGLEGLADALAQSTPRTGAAEARGARVRACEAGPCDGARERAAVLLASPSSLPTPAVADCRRPLPETVRWLKTVLPRFPAVADDIMTTPFGRELEPALVTVAQDEDVAAATALARKALKRHPNRCAAP